MKKFNPARDKSYEFAILIVKVCRKIQLEKKEFDLTRQLVRSGTSIGANVEEALGGFSRKDFLYKIGLAYKEARESNYWIRILFDSEFLQLEDRDQLIEKSEELLKILGSIQRTSRVNLKML